MSRQNSWHPRQSARDDLELDHILRLVWRRWWARSHRAEEADRNLWVALDHHLRTGKHRAKDVAEAWAFLITAAEVYTIASRMQRRPEFRQILRQVDAAGLRKALQWHRERLTHIDGWRRHVEALRSLQSARSS